MKVDRIINRILFAIFGAYNEDYSRAHFHSQNLNEDKHGNYGLPYHGRWWFRWNGKEKFSGEWHFLSKSFAFEAMADYEVGKHTMIHFAIPPISIFLTVPFGIHKKSSANLFSFRIFEWAFWWQFGGSTMSWDSRTPKWKRGTFHLDDFILGRKKYTKRDIETRNIKVPMPEGEYDAVATLEECTWKRPRWFADRRFYVDVKIEDGIPFQGKGENSWDCGEDGLFGYSSEGKSFHDAAQKGTDVVLKNRRKYDGNMMAKYPEPAIRKLNLEALRKNSPPSEGTAEAT